MKRIHIFIIASLYCLTLKAQDIVKIVDATQDARLANLTLPFDRPFIVKYTNKEPPNIEYIGLVTIKKKDAKQYYEDFLSNSIAIQDTRNQSYKIQALEVQTTTGMSGNDIVYNTSIVVPALMPNSFYDIVILRHPFDYEAERYFELFKIYHDNANNLSPEYYNKLREINLTKKPFFHLTGAAEQTPLITFYTMELSSLYTNYDAANVADKEKIKANIKNRIKSYGKNPAGVFLFIYPQSLGLTSTSFSFDTRTSFSITPDFGYVYYGFQKNFYGLAPYLGLQIELRYFDKNYPFWLIKNKSILHYLSITTGITLSSLKKENKREDLFSGKSFLLGIGARITNATRLTFGGIFFNGEDINPFVDNKRLGVTPFVGLSIDLKLKSIINDLTGLSVVNRK